MRCGAFRSTRARAGLAAAPSSQYSHTSRCVKLIHENGASSCLRFLWIERRQRAGVSRGGRRAGARDGRARHRPRLRRRLRRPDGSSCRRGACVRWPCDRCDPGGPRRAGDCTSRASRSARRAFDARAQGADGGTLGCICRAAGRFWHLRRVVRSDYLDSARSPPQTMRCLERRRLLRPAAGANRWRGARRLHRGGRPRDRVRHGRSRRTARPAGGPGRPA